MKTLVRHKLLQFITLIVVACASLSVSAQEYVVGVEDIDYYPIYAKRENQYAGFSRELLDAFAKDQGLMFKYKALPIKRLFSTFIDGGVDFKFPDNAYWKQDLKAGKNIAYSDPVLEYIDGVMVLPDNLKAGQDKLKRLGVVRGFTPWDYLDDITANKVKIKENTTLEGLMKLVKNSRIDGVYFNVIVARYFLKSSLFEDKLVVFDDSLPHTRSHYSLSSIKHPDLITRFNAFLKDNAGFVEKLKIKYNVKLL